MLWSFIYIQYKMLRAQLKLDTHRWNARNCRKTRAQVACRKITKPMYHGLCDFDENFEFKRQLWVCLYELKWNDMIRSWTKCWHFNPVRRPHQWLDFVYHNIKNKNCRKIWIEINLYALKLNHMLKFKINLIMNFYYNTYKFISIHIQIEQHELNLKLWIEVYYVKLKLNNKIWS